MYTKETMWYTAYMYLYSTNDVSDNQYAHTLNSSHLSPVMSNAVHVRYTTGLQKVHEKLWKKLHVDSKTVSHKNELY